MDFEYLRTRAILSPTNDIVDIINNYNVSLVPGDEKQYLSCDTILKGLDTHESYDLLYPTEFLNSLNVTTFLIIDYVLKRSTGYAPLEFKSS
jgi:hypothetical protein